MKVLVKTWLDIYHSYANVAYFLLKYMQQNEKIELFVQEAEYYNPQWKKHYQNNLDIKKYNGEKIDLVFSMYFPYVYDFKFQDVPQVIFYTAEIPLFNSGYWNISLEQIKQLVDAKKLILLTPSFKSAEIFKQTVPVYVIPHGFNKDVYYPTENNFRKQLAISEDAKVFLNVSSCTGNKNLQLILQSFLLMEDKSSILILKGIDSLYKSRMMLESQLCCLGMDIDYSRIRFVFETLSFENMNRLYNTADVYVSSGIYEGFDVPIVEAKACGLTIITHKESPNHFLADYTFNDKLMLKYQMESTLPKAKIPYVDKQFYEKYNYKSIADLFIELFSMYIRK